MSDIFNEEDRDIDNKNNLMLFATERVEDYVVLSLALVILIIILFLY